MRIKKIKSKGLYIYPATIAAAIKDANFRKEDGSIMTQGEINALLANSVPEIDLSDYAKTKDVEENEKVTAAALVDLDTRVSDIKIIVELNEKVVASSLVDLDTRIGNIDTLLTNILG